MIRMANIVWKLAFLAMGIGFIIKLAWILVKFAQSLQLITP